MLQHMLGKRSGTSEWLQGYGDSLGHTATNGTAMGYGRAPPCASEQSSTRAAQSSTAMLLSPRTLCRGGSAITRAECYRTGKQVTSATEDIKAGTHERKANRSSCACASTWLTEVEVGAGRSRGLQNGATGSEDSQPGTPVVPGIPVPCPQCPAISFCPTLQRLSAETTSPGTAMCPRRHRLNPRGAAAAPPHIPARGALRTAAPSPPRREPRSPGAPAAAPGRGKPGGRGGESGHGRR